MESGREVGRTGRKEQRTGKGREEGTKKHIIIPYT